jgi:cathepsin L
MSEIWTDYKNKHNKQYRDDNEEVYRYSVFMDNVAYIQKHNLQADLGKYTYTLGINQFSDMTVHEFRKTMLGLKIPANFNETVKVVSWSDAGEMPTKVDWRDKGYVTRVKNQGQCGSCWAFSATGTLEGQHFRKTGQLVSLSEQNLVDCSGKMGNEGCDGGFPVRAIEYVIENGGIDTEDSYPYRGVEGPCMYNPHNVGATAKGYRTTRRGDETALKAAVASVGPISVCINAAHQSFMHYKSGVYNEPACTSALDHAVLAVGYGTYNGLDYWLIKNSWSTAWGMEGYVMMSRNKNNQCGIADLTVYPVV